LQLTSWSNKQEYYYTLDWLERLAGNKHPSLLGQFVS
jgi:hypothetical protein